MGRYMYLIGQTNKNIGQWLLRTLFSEMEIFWSMGFARFIFLKNTISLLFSVDSPDQPIYFFVMESLRIFFGGGLLLVA